MQNLSLINYSASPFVGLMTCAVMREAGLLACHVRQFLALFQPLVYVLTVRTGRAALQDITGLKRFMKFKCCILGSLEVVAVCHVF